MATWKREDEVCVLSYGLFCLKHRISFHSTGTKCLAPFLIIQNRSTSGLTNRWSELARDHYGRKPKDLTWEAVKTLDFVEGSSSPQSVACQISQQIRKFEAELDVETLRKTDPGLKSNTDHNTNPQKRRPDTYVDTAEFRSKRANTSSMSLVQLGPRSQVRSTPVKHAPKAQGSSVDDTIIDRTPRRPSVSTMSPPESPRYGPRPTLLDVERHPYQTPVGQVPLDISDECAEDFRLALKAILSKISDTLNSLVLDKELDDRVICAVADARRSLKKVHHTYTATTDLNCSQGLSKLFKFQDRIAMVRHQYNVNSIRQRLHPSEKGILVELLRHQQEELSLAYSFQHEDARLRTLTDRPVGTDIQRERATLKTISNHIEEFSRNYTYQLAINLPSFDELERQPSSGMATLILRNLGVQSQLTAISRRRRYAFSQSGTAAMMSALIVAALCHWVYETAFPSGPEDSYLRYQLMRKLIPHLMGSLEKQATLNDVDQLVQEDYLKNEVFLKQILRPKATLLARRLSKTLAPWITYSPRLLGRSISPSAAAQPDTDMQSNPFHTWGQPTDEWETRERLFTAIFEEALTQKAGMLLSDEEYEMMLPPPGTPWDDTIMEAHEHNRTPACPPAEVSACLSPALFVYTPVDAEDLEPQLDQLRQPLNYKRFRTFDSAERARRKGKCIRKAQVVLRDVESELRGTLTPSSSHSKSLRGHPHTHSNIKRDWRAFGASESRSDNSHSWSGCSSGIPQQADRLSYGGDRESTLEV